MHDGKELVQTGISFHGQVVVPACVYRREELEVSDFSFFTEMQRVMVTEWRHEGKVVRRDWAAPELRPAEFADARGMVFTAIGLVPITELTWHDIASENDTARGVATEWFLNSDRVLDDGTFVPRGLLVKRDAWANSKRAADLAGEQATL